MRRRQQPGVAAGDKREEPRLVCRSIHGDAGCGNFSGDGGTRVVAVRVVGFEGERAGVGLAVRCDGIDLVQSETTNGIEAISAEHQADVMKANREGTGLLPDTHTDVAAEGGQVSIFKLSTIAVPLVECLVEDVGGIADGIRHLPHANDSGLTGICLDAIGEL